MPRRKTNQEFLSEVREKHPSIRVLGKYAGSKEHILVECGQCGYRWSPQAGSLQQGKGCPRCAGKLKRTTKQFVSELEEKKPSIEVLGNYVDTSTKIEVRCKNCGHVWSAPPVMLLSKSGCPKCAGNQKKTTQEFCSDLEAINPNIEVIGEYVTSKTKLEVSCKRCGWKWKATPNVLLRGSGCPNCYRGSTSYLEQCIYVSLCHILGADQVQNRDRSAIGAELDIYVPSKCLAIEPGAWHWHKPALKGDWGKRVLCQQNGIRLITIYDSCRDKQEPQDDVLYYREDLGRPQADEQLRKLIEKIASIAGLRGIFSDEDWSDIKREAHLRASKRTTREFVEALKDVNPEIEVKGEYGNSSTKLQVECLSCGHLWEASPTQLLGGHGCPKCGVRARAAKQRKTHEAFLRQIKDKGYPISIVGTYSGDSRPVKTECVRCGYIWEPTPNNLLHGEGCPICGRKSSDAKRQKPVLCVETGVVYEGVTKAAKAAGVGQSAISNALRTGGKSGGYHWVFCSKSDAR